MIVRLISFQIPVFWDTIKYVLREVEALGAKNEVGVYNHVFAKLLCDKMQCFMIYRDDAVVGTIITEMLENEVTHDGTLVIRAVYAFEPNDKKTWKQAFGLIKRMAKKDKCYRILLSFSNPKMKALSEAQGFREISTQMEFTVGE